MAEKIVELKFINSTENKELAVRVVQDSVANITPWYDACHLDHDYNVFVDGKEVSVDENGELLTNLESL